MTNYYYYYYYYYYGVTVQNLSIDVCYMYLILILSEMVVFYIQYFLNYTLQCSARHTATISLSSTFLVCRIAGG